MSDVTETKTVQIGTQYTTAQGKLHVVCLRDMEEALDFVEFLNEKHPESNAIVVTRSRVVTETAWEEVTGPFVGDIPEDEQGPFYVYDRYGNKVPSTGFSCRARAIKLAEQWTARKDEGYPFFGYLSDARNYAEHVAYADYSKHVDYTKTLLNKKTMINNAFEPPFPIRRMSDNMIRIRTDRGIELIVRYVPDGGTLRDTDIVHNGEPIVEWYDSRYPYTPLEDGWAGQFTGASYYLQDMLRDHNPPSSWRLHTEVQDWEIDTMAMAAVRGWLRGKEQDGGA